MSEERTVYEVLKPTQKHDSITQTHNVFVDVRTRRGKLIFRFDPIRMLVEWREAKDIELIDLMPYLTR